MPDKVLFRLSLLIAILGIATLLILSNYLSYKKITTKEVKDQPLLSKVEIEGKIKKIISYRDYQSLILQDKTGEISVFVEKTKLQENQSLIVRGSIKEYKDKYEIIPDKIILNKE